MHKVIAAFIAVGIAIAQMQFPVAQAAYSNMYEDAIEYLQDESIAGGYLDGSFKAEQNINRAEFSKVIMLAVNEEEDDMHGSYCFHDVHTEWFAMYVCTARNHGMVTGYPDGMFHPERPVSFAEAASLVVHAYNGNVSGEGKNWYMPYIEKLEDWDAVPPTIRMVHNPITRGEMAYMIWKIELLNDPEDEEDEEEEMDLDVSIRYSEREVSINGSVTYTIKIENEGPDDVEVDVEVELDNGLKVTNAQDSDDSNDDSIEWDNVEIDEDDDITLTFTAVVLSSAVAGQTLTAEVTVEDEEEEADITVKSIQNTYTSPVGDPVLYWNAIALQANADDHSGTFGTPQQGGPGASSRALAIVHAAIFDAANSIDRGYQPYIALAPIQQNEHVSMDTAVATAAYRTLVALYPRMKSTFDSSYQTHLSLIADSAEKTAGIRVGDSAAQLVLNARQNDGASEPDTYTASNDPGKHRPDPINPNQPFMGATWGHVKPFAIQSNTQFLSTPPPALASKEYADAFNELKMFGGDGITTPTVRTQEQTDIGIFWAYDGVKKIGTPPRLLNQITRVIAQSKGNTIMQNARLFALINMAQADAGIAAWHSKYFYNVWRPIIGIREADAGTGPSGLGDNNLLTTGFAGWTPLGAPMSNMTMNNFTPPFPAYPSGHATFGGAVFHTIEKFYGTDNIAFTITSDELNGVTTDNQGIVRRLAPRSFNRLSDAAKENADSRVYLGVHWRFDQTAGMTMGTAIADYIYSNALKPVE